MKFAVVSLIPEMFNSIQDFGVTSRAFERGLVTLTVVNPREFAEDRHGTVDDRPYGGGPGMVLKAEPMLAAVKAAKAAVGGRPIVVHFSPRGKPLDQGLLASWIEHFDEMVFLASRYEGLDERVIESVVDLEVCVGDFVVSGGELPAMMALDAMIRLLPGVLGDESSKMMSLLLTDCSNTRSIRVLKQSVGESCQRCCSAATTRPSRSGGISSL